MWQGPCLHQNPLSLGRKSIQKQFRWFSWTSRFKFCLLLSGAIPLYRQLVKHYCRHSILKHGRNLYIITQCLVRKLDLHRCPIKVPYFVTFQRYIVSFCCNQCYSWSASSIKSWDHKSPDPVALKHWLAGVFYWLARHTLRQPPRYAHSQTSCCVSWLHWFLFVSSVLSSLHGSHPCTP